MTVALDLLTFTSADFETSRGLIDSIYGIDRPVPWSGDASAFRFSLRSATAGVLGVDRARLRMNTHNLSYSPATFFALVATHGAMRLRCASSEIVQTPQMVTCFPEDPFECRLLDFGWRALRLPMAVVERAVDEQYGPLAEPFRFTGLTPVSPSAAGQWRALSAYVQHECDSPTTALDQPLVTAALVDLIAVTALSVFPNTATGAAHLPGPGGAPPRTVRAAADYMRAHVREPLTVTGIAEVVGVTPRALQAAFARHYETRPMRYLQRLRLAGAHHDLRAAGPADTVPRIAGRWGFGPHARFAEHYRAVYGMHPSQTLRAAAGVGPTRTARPHRRA